MRSIAFSFIVAFVCHALSGCGEACVDVGPNFTLAEVAYDEDASELYISGVQSLSHCGDDAPRYGSMLLVLSPADGEFQTDIQSHHDRKIPEVPLLARNVFSGEFSSMCTDCVLSMKTKDEKYSLEFLTGQHLWDLGGSADGVMVMSVSSQDELLSRFVFGMLSIEKWAPDDS
jgi:hypothetical protein